MVITGQGVVSSLGHTADEFYNNLLAGKSGISMIEGWDTGAGQSECQNVNRNTPSVTSLVLWCIDLCCASSTFPPHLCSEVGSRVS